MTLMVGSLFTGIGGFDLGFEFAGMNTVWQVENDEYANRVLTRRWSDVRRWGDVRTFSPNDGYDWGCDVICGGFPCQDISIAGRGRGLDGERSGLWREMLRVVQAIRPRFVVIENTPPLYYRGLHRVLSDLAATGYDAEWETISARQFGRSHARERVYIVAYPDGIGRNDWGDHVTLGEISPGWEGVPAADGWKDGWDVERWVSSFYSVCGFPPADPASKRMVDGIPARLDRLRVCGNAVAVPIVEWIGRRIVHAAEGLVE